MNDPVRKDYQTLRQERLSQALAAARAAAHAMEPKKLVASLCARGQALTSLHNGDSWNGYNDSLQAEFGAPALHSGQPLAASWCGLLAWALDVLQHWTDEQDPAQVRLSAAFVVFGGLDAGPFYWQLLPMDFSISAELETFLARALPALLGEIQTTSRAELWEAELVERLLRADADGDWISLEQDWPASEALTFALATPLVGCITTLLARTNLSTFAQTMESVPGFLASYAVVDRLTTEQRLRVALATKTPALPLAAIIASSLNRSIRLSPIEQELMAQVFTQAARSLDGWRTWMTMLNRYPVRRPAIQAPLGAALSGMSDEARHIYCDAIELSAVNGDNLGRLAVGECLAAFRRLAPEAIRRRLWAYSHRRWTKWGFGKGEGGQHLLRLAGSQLDYAVIAYFAECLDDNARQQFIDETLEQLTRNGTAWHRDRLAYESGHYGLLSALQPCCTAHLRTPDRWMEPRQQYQPDLEPAVARYRDFHLVR